MRLHTSLRSSFSFRTYNSCGTVPMFISLQMEMLFIGRAKRAPHWGVQSRFRVIYIYIYVCMSSIVYGKTIQKNRMLKCVGGIT